MHRPACPGLLIALKPVAGLSSQAVVMFKTDHNENSRGPASLILAVPAALALRLALLFFLFVQRRKPYVMPVYKECFPKGAGGWLDHGLSSRWLTVLFP